jgi:hypothetical protein
METKISLALVLLSSSVFFTLKATERNNFHPPDQHAHGVAGALDVGQQGGPPQNVDDSRSDSRNDAVRQAAGRADAPREGDTVTLPANSVISVRIADEINSSKNHTGDLFSGIVDPSVLVHDQVLIPRGTEAHVRMTRDKKGGHFHGKARVSLELVSLVVNGYRLGVESDVHEQKKGALAAKSEAEKNSVEHMGSASGLAGPAGGAAGPVIAVFSAAKVEIKPSTRVQFTLSEPFTFEKPPVAVAAQP